MNTPKAPSPWPPRFLAVFEEPNSIATLVTEFNAMSVAEHTHLLAEAVREAKAQAFEEAAEAIGLTLQEYHEAYKGTPSELLIKKQDILFEKASELRKGATPENGGK